MAARLEPRLHHPTAARIEAGPVQAQPQPQSEPLQIGAPGDVKEVETRAGADVRAARQRQLARFSGAEHQRQVENLRILLLVILLLSATN